MEGEQEEEEEEEVVVGEQKGGGGLRGGTPRTDHHSSSGLSATPTLTPPTIPLVSLCTLTQEVLRDISSPPPNLMNTYTSTPPAPTRDHLLYMEASGRQLAAIRSCVGRSLEKQLKKLSDPLVDLALTIEGGGEVGSSVSISQVMGHAAAVKDALSIAITSAQSWAKRSMDNALVLSPAWSALFLARFSRTIYHVPYDGATSRQT